jgi:uncharacterized membrane protein
MMRSVRTQLIAGLLVVLPTVVAFYVLYRVGDFLDRILNPLLIPLFERVGLPRIPFVGLVLLILLVWMAGGVASNLIGRQLIGVGETLLIRIPLFNRIYIAVKQILEVFLQDRQAVFNRVVLIEFPRKNVFALGFVTLEPPPREERSEGTDLVHVFLPTAPNPTSGFFLMVPTEDVLPLDMTVEEGLKMVISGGAIGPPLRPTSRTGEADARDSSPGKSLEDRPGLHT